jgi:phage tail-like protein
VDFSVLGPHSPAAWSDWQRRNVEILGESEEERPADPAENGVRIAPRAHPLYPAAERILEGATGWGAASRRVSDETPPQPGPESLALIDIAVDDCGHLYLLTEGGDVNVYDPANHVLVRRGCLFSDAGEPRAIAVTEQSLYVARADPGAIHAYSRQLGQTKWILERGIVDPVAFVRDGDEVHLLDRGANPGRGHLGRVVEAAAVETIVTGLREPIDADFDDAGTLYVLESQLRDGSPDDDSPEDRRYLVRRFDPRALDRPPVPAAETVWIPPDAFRIHDTGEPFVPGCLAAGAAGEVIVGVAPDSDSERWLLGYRPDEAAFDYHARFSEGCRVLLADRRHDERRLFLVDGERRLFGVDAVAATRRDRVTGRFEGYLRTHFDAGTEGTQWHRLRLDGNQNADTSVRLHYRAVDVEPPQPASTDPDAERGALRTVSGIGRRTAWRLRRAGIPDLAALVDRDPETIAIILGTEEIRVGTDRVADWQARAESLLDDASTDETDLQLVDGIGPIRASRLRAAGVTTLTEFVSLKSHVISGLLTRELQAVPIERIEEWFERARARLAQLPDEPGFAVDEEWTTVSTTRPRDVLLEEATGRYLQVQLDLVGTTYDSPLVASLDASHPRRSYADELPAVYREQHGEFLERFLALFERIFTDVDGGIDDLTRYLDPAAIPAEPGHLEWLGGFLATEMDEGWPTAAKREFVERAPELYRNRGTRRGLLAAIDVYLNHVEVRRSSWDRALRRERARLDRLVERGYLSSQEATAKLDQLRALSASDDEPLVRIVEHAELECIDDPEVRELYSRVISCPEGFLVLCHPRLGDEQFRAIGRIVRSQQPAHASGRAVALRHLTVLPGADGRRGYHSYLGINTVLESHGFELEDATLGQDTRLESREAHATLGVRSRLDEDARIS